MAKLPFSGDFVDLDTSASRVRSLSSGLGSMSMLPLKLGTVLQCHPRGFDIPFDAAGPQDHDFILAEEIPLHFSTDLNALRMDVRLDPTVLTDGDDVLLERDRTLNLSLGLRDLLCRRARP